MRSMEPHLSHVFMKLIGQDFVIEDQNEDEESKDR